MNSIEEKLWNYIDGTCTPAEQQAIAQLIEQDEVYRRKYDELLSLNAKFAAIELDEPPMAFTYNVMEQIRTEQAAKPLRAAVDTRIIKGIAAFFILTISLLVIYALSTVNWTTGGGISFEMPKVALPEIKTLFTGPIVQGFVFFDIVLGLYLFDAWLRRKKVARVV